ncbi:hypothetical protein G6K87_26120 (plasmid) [Agrobacterium tumefaciens]|uniref:Uncharacterized protein n=2 Tax=Agrobacterium tumefaciens TaxID=358 RepID=A0A2Z2PPG2_AGRTU|nr:MULTISPECIES: hypothetical protein [Agrobacterium tumefaciens complex]ASK43512.1 hypothetical protein [Agrobacterium radiobacter]NSY04792.1 hypothetical protein [Agrobacterium tumefaciens]QEG98067.1 hypothetical protein AgrTiT37_00104 [Agrobacterium tumefaciens]
MSQHPRKGRAVSFSRELAVSPDDEPDTVTGLRLIIDTQDGGKVLIDYAHLSPRWLAIAFARALRRLAGLGGRLSVRSTVTDFVRILPMFLAYLVEAKNEPDAPERLRPDHIDGFEAWLAAKGKSNIHLLFILTKVIVALREVSSEGSVTFSEQLRDRLAYFTLRPIPPSHPRDAYSPHIARQLRDAARADIMGIVHRLRDRRPMNSHSGLLAMEKEIDAHIEAKGVVRHTDPKYHVLNDARRVHGLSSERLCHQLHERHYLTFHDVIPLMVFLALETGLEPECCKSLRVDCLRNPANGTVEIAYVKRRARGAEHKTLRVRDGGPRTPGGLIRHVVAWTATARKHRPTDCLWLYYGLGGLRSGVNHPQQRIDAWTARHNIRHDDGRPFHLTLSRLRKTHKALWYLKTEGHMTRFAAGHTKEVAARHYADVPALRPLHEATIADAFTEAVTSALSSTVLTPEQEETWRNDPVAASKAAPEGCDPMSLLDGKQDIWLASCGGFFSSPYAEHGSPCSQPFWGCLECPNAVITTRKLPAILSFLAFLEGQRLLLSASHWATKFATAHARITMQILPAFGSATVEEARRVLASEPVSNYMPPEALL